MKVPATTSTAMLLTCTSAAVLRSRAVPNCTAPLPVTIRPNLDSAPSPSRTSTPSGPRTSTRRPASRSAVAARPIAVRPVRPDTAAGSDIFRTSRNNRRGWLVCTTSDWPSPTRCTRWPSVSSRRSNEHRQRMGRYGVRLPSGDHNAHAAEACSAVVIRGGRRRFGLKRSVRRHVSGVDHDASCSTFGVSSACEQPTS